MNAPLLLTPGPLTTDARTREAMTVDFGSRDPAFVAMCDEMRDRLTRLVGDSDALAAIPLQGSGTYAVEAALGTLVPRTGKVLVLVNGAYGRRMVEICQRIGRHVTWLEHAETDAVDLGRIDRALATDPDLTHVAAVWCETTTGILNPVQEIARLVATHRRALLIDAMSAFGALPLRLDDVPFDAVMASSNKCLEGAPGLGFVITRRAALMGAEGRCHSVALDLHAQHQRFDKDGQWRFTPPTHVVAAFVQALRLHEAEGGVQARGARYTQNCHTLVRGMRALGFRTMLPDTRQAPIIVTFHEPADPAWSFPAFYDALVEAGFAIYPGKLTRLPTFRVGCIGQVFPADIDRFVEAVAGVMQTRGLRSGAPAPGAGGH